MSEVEIIEPKKKGKQAQLPRIEAPMTPPQMIQQAMAAGQWDHLEKLMAFQERWEERNARRAYNAAISAVRADIPVIVKTRYVRFGTGRAAYWYEDLAEIARTIDPILSQHGLSYRWRTETVPAEGLIVVTCIVSHRDGYTTENSLPAPRDESGNKNPIQAISSTVTYLQRITLKAALGLAAGKDDDARATSPSTATIDSEQLQKLDGLMKEVKQDTKRFLDNYGIESLPDLPAAAFAEAVDFLERKKAKQEASSP